MTRQPIQSNPAAVEKIRALLLENRWAAFREAYGELHRSQTVLDADTAHSINPAFIGFVRGEFLQHGGQLPACFVDGREHSFTPKPAAQTLLSPRESTDRVRYQLRHFDMLEDFGRVLQVAAQAGVVLTPSDVSAECASYIRGRLKNPPASDEHLRAHWRDMQPVTRTA